MKTTAKCPECNAEISYLIASEMRDTELKATYDAKEEELQLEPTEEWRGNPIGQQKDIVFFCPEENCQKLLFISEDKAREFLSGAITESDVKDKTMKWSEAFVREILKDVPYKLLEEELHGRKMRSAQS